MIPVLICPVLNRFDLLERMLNSIDHPIGRVVIVDNSCSNYVVPKEIQLPVTYIRPVSGLGYGGAINQGIMQNADATWWMWTSNDLVFAEGDLGNIAARMMESIPNRPRFISYGFTYGAINRPAVDKVGLVDEWSFFPIYYDDNDYYRRLRLAGVEVIDYKGGILHGEDGKGSLTISSSEDARRANNKSFIDNKRRYIEKWGGEPHDEVYDTPWNTGYPLWYTKPDMVGRSQRIW